MLKFIVTTSNLYLHLIPVFTYLFNKYWPETQPVTVLGYEPPRCDLPDNFTFVSMGKQGAVNEWSTDIRNWIEAQPEDDQWYCWLFDDTILRSVNMDQFDYACAVMAPDIGRIALTKDPQNRPHHIDEAGFVWAAADSRYRLSTQPSIWNRAYLLQYLTPGLSPWDFETQDPVNDGWYIVGVKDYPIVANEGVTKRDIWRLDLSGLDAVAVRRVNEIIIEQKKII